MKGLVFTTDIVSIDLLVFMLDAFFSSRLSHEKPLLGGN